MSQATDDMSSTKTGLARPSNVRYYVLAVGCSMALVTYVQRQGLVRALPEIMTDLHLDEEHAGYLLAAFLLAYGIFQVPSGLISDRIGARHLLTNMVLGWSVVMSLTVLVAFLTPAGVWPFAFLLAMRFLFGAFQAGAFPIWSRVMTDWMTLSTRASGQGAVWMFSRAGGALGPYLFLWLFLAFHSWSIPLLLLSGVGILWACGFWLWFRNRPDEMRGVNDAELALIAGQEKKASAKSEPVPWSIILRSTNVWALSLMYGFVGFAGNFITNMLPVYLKSDRKLNPELTTLLTSLPPLFGIVSCSLGGILSDWIIRKWKSRKWGRRIVAATGLVVAGLTMATVPWVTPIWLLALLLSASFFCNDLMLASAWAACADVGERYAGTISGTMNMTGQFFGAAGMCLAGVMLHRGNPHLLFFVFGCSYFLAASCWFAVDVTRPVHTNPTR